MTNIIALIASLCIHTTQYETKEAKIACIDFYSNCLVDNPNKLDYCKSQEVTWTKKHK